MIAVLADGAGFVAVAKPPGRIVVPGRGSAASEVTVRRELEEQLGRALLVVHRLDRGTSGVLIFATDAAAHRSLSRAFERHVVVKRYLALVRGTLIGSGEIDRPLVPVRGGLVRVAHSCDPGAKPAQTAWRALERFPDFTLVELRPRTGRLHQIRAHLQLLGHPLAVDPHYGGRASVTVADLRAAAEPGVPGGREVDLELEAEPAAAGTSRAVALARTPLHAASIKFPHPVTGDPVEVEAPLTDDLAHVLALLRCDRLV